MERAVSRILYLKNQAMIIYLGQRSPAASSNLPGNIGRAALKRFPIWSCTGWGLPCLSCHHESGELLPRRFTLTPANRGGLFSVALSRSRPRFALRTTLPCGVRTFLRPADRRSCARSIKNFSRSPYVINGHEESFVMFPQPTYSGFCPHLQRQ